MGKCAYCFKPKPLTREHVLPKFALALLRNQANPKLEAGWNERAKKYIAGEATVRDVCGDCNNGPLSTLDEYAAKFFLHNSFFVRNFTANSIELKYDYSLLLRWLLKVSYNSARASDPKEGEFDDSVSRFGLPQTAQHAAIFHDFLNFILVGTPFPSYKQCMCIAELVSPSRLSESEVKSLPPGEICSKNGLYNPFIFRVARGYPTSGFESFAVRLVALGALHFYLIFPANDAKSKPLSALRRDLQRSFPNRVQLKRNISGQLIKASNRTYLETQAHHAMRALQLGAKPDDPA